MALLRFVLFHFQTIVHRCFLAILGALFGSVANAGDYTIESLCNAPWRAEAKVICSDVFFVKQLREFESQYWQVVSEQKSLEDLRTVVRLKSTSFDSKVMLSCSMYARQLPSKAESYVECVRDGVSVFRSELASKYPRPTEEVLLYASSLDAALARSDALERDLYNNVKNCQVRQADALDDRISPASDIAIAVAGLCKNDAFLFTRFMVSKLTGDIYPFSSLFGGSVDTSKLQLDIAEQYFGKEAATAIVLQRRAVRLKAQQEADAAARKEMEEAARKAREEHKKQKKKPSVSA